MLLCAVRRELQCLQHARDLGDSTGLLVTLTRYPGGTDSACFLATDQGRA